MDKLKNLFIADVKNAENTEELVSYYAIGLTNLLALFLYLIMLVLFHMLKIPFLTVFSAFNVGLQVVLIGFNRKGKLKFAAILPVFTVILYVFIVTLLVGWEAGYQWYILAAIIPQYLFVRTNMGWKLLLTTLGILSLIMLFFIGILLTPIYNQGDNHALQFMNLLLFISTLLAEIKMNDIAFASSLRHHAEHIDMLEKKSMIDPLTGLWNRRYAERLFNSLTDCGTNFCISLLDIDYFKKINDTYGHPVGDQALILLSKILLTGFRSSDTVIRWGGEEFLVLLQNTKLADAWNIMENIRKRVESENYKIETHNISFTITIGIAEYENNFSINELIERTDYCLYQGKKRGRNQIVVYSKK